MTPVVTVHSIVTVRRDVASRCFFYAIVGGPSINGRPRLAGPHRAVTVRRPDIQVNAGGASTRACRDAMAVTRSRGASAWRPGARPAWRKDER
ncbi:hypothetical protein FRACA_270030 [Frankia canadensis]|uniref:Uncharacterized protein n=1 Tax=Frankia canadensis TaxID=1836972 RepID=A0A2I2KSQ9_9ACTN|nr:hypothetical protein FRACA_270030 [Frankia canadensis]SOU56003.1 hypothetical protein FRACA_270030 [Frankia canadensis]